MTRSRDYTDILAGCVLVAIGLFAALYATKNYDIGTVEEMGPGMFPAAVGWVMTAIGVLIAAPAFFRLGEMPRPEWRPAIMVIAGVLAFAATVDVLGMVTALMLLTVIAVTADDKLGWKGALALAVGITVLATLIFRVALEIPLPLFKWGF
ncbi:MAG: hypothetical protein A3H32_07860 [Betaproteobacteria bacterium RIFCSPLOWO2_02_FULL_63_19]|nr:MAG: hypothetical protein A3H32_07860 [Betaproteobacteria bacterium RIFCSPLOWO2_02_FULL_63_19]